MYRYAWYPYDMINRRLFETIFSRFGKIINNVSFFYEVNKGIPRDEAFFKLFKGRLVNVIDRRRVSTWPGTIAFHNDTEAISCLYDRRLKNVFLTKIAPFLFDSFDKEIDVAAVKLRLQNADEAVDDDELDDEATAEWFQRDHFSEWVDVSVVANDGFPLFYTTAHEKYATLLVPNDAWTLFLPKLQVDESFFEEVGDVDFDKWKSCRYYVFDHRERGFYEKKERSKPS